MINTLKNKISLIITKCRWKAKNKHNKTWANTVFDVNKVLVGNGTYGAINVFNDTKNKLIIGSFCSIANGTMFLVGGEHNMNRFSTFPFKTFYLNQKGEATSKGDIIVGDDVWFGYSSTILSGVKIGQGAVIGACSVVTKNVPPYAIVAGNPAKIIRYRFNDEILKNIDIDYSILDYNIIQKHINDLYININDKCDIERISRIWKR